MKTIVVCQNYKCSDFISVTQLNPSIPNYNSKIVYVQTISNPNQEFRLNPKGKKSQKTVLSIIPKKCTLASRYHSLYQWNFTAARACRSVKGTRKRQLTPKFMTSSNTPFIYEMPYDAGFFGPRPLHYDMKRISPLSFNISRSPLETTKPQINTEVNPKKIPSLSYLLFTVQGNSPTAFELMNSTITLPLSLSFFICR